MRCDPIFSVHCNQQSLQGFITTIILYIVKVQIINFMIVDRNKIKSLVS